MSADKVLRPTQILLALVMAVLILTLLSSFYREYRADQRQERQLQVCKTITEQMAKAVCTGNSQVRING